MGKILAIIKDKIFKNINGVWERLTFMEIPTEYSFIVVLDGSLSLQIAGILIERVGVEWNRLVRSG